MGETFQDSRGERAARVKEDRSAPVGSSILELRLADYRQLPGHFLYGVVGCGDDDDIAFQE